MAQAGRTRQSGDAATRWPITILLSNDSNAESLENKTVLSARAIRNRISSNFFRPIIALELFSRGKIKLFFLNNFEKKLKMLNFEKNEKYA